MSAALLIAAAASLSPLGIESAQAFDLAQAPGVDPQLLAIDGDPSEWIGSGPAPIVLDRAEQLVALHAGPPEERWSGPRDASLELWVGWTGEDLLLGGTVLDEIALHDPQQWFRGDTIEIFFNAADRVPEWGGDDFQVMLAPNWPDRPWGVYLRAEERGAVNATHAGWGGVEVASLPLEGGFRFEARIPWTNFGLSEVKSGDGFGFNVALTDRDDPSDQDSYLTWTGESEIAAWADRRGELLLAGSPPEVQAVEPTEEPGALFENPVMPLLLLGLYGLALLTRGLWRSRRARALGLGAGAVLLLAAGALVLLERAAEENRRELLRGEVEDYWRAFEGLVHSGALGHPEPGDLRSLADALLSGETITPVASDEFLHLVPADALLDEERHTARRGIPYRPVGRLDAAAAGGSGRPEGPGRPLVLQPSDRLSLPLPRAVSASAVHLVTRVTDRIWNRYGPRPLPVLAVETFLRGELQGSPLEVRHHQDLHLDEVHHLDRPGLEPAFYAMGGRLGRVHGDGLELELVGERQIDEVIVRHLGDPPDYAVQLVAASVRVSQEAATAPAGLQATAGGEWQWAHWREGIEALVLPTGRAPGGAGREQITRPLRLGSEPVGVVYLARTGPPPTAGGWGFLPVGLALGVAPFLVAMLAEALAARPRIRLKLAVGFAVSSAVPLLALTLLLDASLRQEHERGEAGRMASLLARADQDLDRQPRALEAEARGLLRVTELELRLAEVSPVELEARDPPLPETEEELGGWWGTGAPGELRTLERLGTDGTLTRVGTGPGWRQIPHDPGMTTGLHRLWGTLYACGVARTASGAVQAMTVMVARTPRLAAPADGQGEAPRLLGAGRDAQPAVDDLSPASPGEVRRGVYGPRGELLGVLVASARERGVPVLSDWSLPELLLAAGLTALFTALLFAGILTGHIVGPIERLDRAVRDGLPEELPIAVADEIGHLTGAIQAFAHEVESRVVQLETLQGAQEEMSSRLDADLAREAILHFFQRETGAVSTWLVWRGGAVEEPRLFGPRGEGRPLPGEGGILGRMLVSTQVLHLVDSRGLPCLREAERALLGPGVERLLGLPLVAAGEVLGAVLLGFPSPAERTDLAFLRTAAAQAAIVLENARLYHQAVNDPVTGFLTEAGFRQRLSEEIRRAEGQGEDAGVLTVQIRLRGLPKDDERATARLREAARRTRLSVRGMAVFGRSGAADLKVALPWSGRTPDPGEAVRKLIAHVASSPWPDGQPVGELACSSASWPGDGPSARFVLALLEERLAEGGGAPAPVSPPVLTGERSLPRDFVAASPLMVDLLDTLRRVAEREVTVLISGETGTGKDRVAELVHRWSPRSDGPLVHIHCPSLPPSLIEDELFGHEEGAFTGAVSRRMGPFEYAAGGTVVLDEIGGLSPDGQVALLRVLETREVLPLGATRPVAIDVRFVVTTSAGLAEEVERGRFRGDLYFRLNIAQLTVPPLRLRKQAIPDLVELVIRRFNASADRPVTGVAPEVMDALYDRDWPGNVRELENALSRALILAPGGELGPEHLEPAGVPEAVAGAPDVPLNARQHRILESLVPGQAVTSSEYAQDLAVSSRTGLRDLQTLVDLGYLAREGQKRGTRFRRTRRGWTGGSVQ